MKQKIITPILVLMLLLSGCQHALNVLESEGGQIATQFLVRKIVSKQDASTKEKLVTITRLLVDVQSAEPQDVSNFIADKIKEQDWSQEDKIDVANLVDILFMTQYAKDFWPKAKDVIAPEQSKEVLLQIALAIDQAASLTVSSSGKISVATNIGLVEIL